MEEPSCLVDLGESQCNAIDGIKLEVQIDVAFCDVKQNVRCLNGAVIVELSSVWVSKVE
jgi:hypothetical protein